MDLSELRKRIEDTPDVYGEGLDPETRAGVLALLDEVERLRQENDIRAQALRDIRKVGHNVYPNRDVTYYQDALWDIEMCCAQASIDLQKLDEG
jgi:hypothetical protein